MGKGSLLEVATRAARTRWNSPRATLSIVQVYLDTAWATKFSMHTKYWAMHSLSLLSILNKRSHHG
eukprot:SAG22_NODE_18463_length_287_cov_0.590426_1_plen_65_part_01